jgi:prepilin-type N-terminal cleavage/methylation domain-containing protein
VKRASQPMQGFSLLELMWVIMISSVLLGGSYAVMQLYARHRLHDAARAWVHLLSAGRALAVRVHAPVVVQPVDTQAVCAVPSSAQAASASRWCGRVGLRRASGGVWADLLRLPPGSSMRFNASFGKSKQVRIDRLGFFEQQGRFIFTAQGHPSWRETVRLRPWGAVWVAS